MFSIGISNFRSFQNEIFNFSKINILIGENSSGKSSLFKFILALKQSLLPPFNREINLAFTGPYADLGSYKESVYYHQDDLPISFSFGFADNYFPFFFKNFIGEKSNPKEFDNIFNHAGNYKTFLSYTITNELDKHETIITNIKNEKIGELYIEHYDNDYEKKLIFGPECKIIYRDKIFDNEYELDEIGYQKDGFMSIIDGSSLNKAINKSLGIDSTSKKSQKNNTLKLQAEHIYNRIAFLLVSQNFLRYHLDKIDYINPINTQPSRVYLLKDEKSSTSIRNIEDVVEFFSKSSELSKSALREFIKILNKFGIADDIEVIKDERLPVRELRVKVKDLFSNISDVGYGVSLQLPIILKALLSDKVEGTYNSILLIEQPEVHLHPKLHAELIETLISLSNNTFYFIETHSEHIIRKLQVLAKEQRFRLKPEDITIHYLKRVAKKSEVTSHIIEKNGLLSPNFPKGFYDNSYELAKQLLD